MLTYGKNVAIRIFEPSHFVAPRGGPDSELAILNERVFFWSDPSFGEPGSHRFDVFYFPAQHRALQRGEIRRLGNPDIVPADSHHQCILIDAHKFESELPLIKGPRFVVVPGEYKSNHFA